MTDDWYRRRTWTDQDQKEFFARLARSREVFHKAQYLFIQAVSLITTKSANNTLAAMSLLQLFLKDYPDAFRIASAYHLLGECHKFLGQHDEAATYYKKALQQQRDAPGEITLAHQDFALFVALQSRRADYDDALAALDEWCGPMYFPIEVFRSYAARSLIHFDRGEKQRAVECAHKALEAAGMEHSGFRYHPKLGLVGETDKPLLDKMRAILGD